MRNAARLLCRAAEAPANSCCMCTHTCRLVLAASPASCSGAPAAAAPAARPAASPRAPRPRRSCMAARRGVQADVRASTRQQQQGLRRLPSRRAAAAMRSGWTHERASRHAHMQHSTPAHPSMHRLKGSEPSRATSSGSICAAHACLGLFGCRPWSSSARAASVASSQLPRTAYARPSACQPRTAASTCRAAAAGRATQRCVIAMQQPCAPCSLACAALLPRRRCMQQLSSNSSRPPHAIWAPCQPGLQQTRLCLAAVRARPPPAAPTSHRDNRARLRGRGSNMRCC